MGTDNALYLDLVKEEFYFGDFSVDGAVVFDQGQVRSLMVSLAEMVDRSTKTHELRQIVDTSIANAIARHYDTGKCDTATQYMELWGNPGICVEPRRKADKSDYIARCDVCTLTSRRPDLVELLAE